MRTRRATVEDGPQPIEVLRRSIMELCVEDLDGDPERLDARLANKTLADWSVWITAPRATVFVAKEGDVIVGVGAVRPDGVVLLNDVSPDGRFLGVRTALLAALEREAAARGAVATTLTSTRTARRFYLARRSIPVGDDEPFRLTRPHRA
jgi:GNAT superfamily N-acetyltransferase